MLELLPNLHEGLLACALAGLISSTVYVVLVVLATCRFRAPGRTHSSAARKQIALPPVSVLKPVHGVEPGLEECLESFFQQNYPEFEIIFGAQHLHDAAWDIIEPLRRKYPNVKSSVIVCGDPVYPNAKVSNLEPMLARASFPYVVIADSDARVAPDTLAEIVPPLVDSGVGLVTCLYRGVPTGGLWSRLEALSMSVEMTSGVLVADMLEGMQFALGPTTATRRDVLQKIGGIGVLGSTCADDYFLGHLTRAAGKTVILSHHVIEHLAVNRVFRASMQHQIRWMRGARFLRPWGHVGMGLTFAVPFGILGFANAVSDGQFGLGVALACWAFANRVTQCLVVGWGAVHDRRSLRYCWMYPAHDLLGFFVWCASFLGTEIVWRGEQYELTTDGRMRRKGSHASLPAAREFIPVRPERLR